ncbi:MAG: lipid II flippase MurJ [Thermotogota bacterium]|nr:lipid II flippase MurJ [Thermotogota bacterium]
MIGRSVAAGAVLITVFTIMSKILGFFREVLLANLFGTSWRLDAVIIALTPSTVITGIISGGLATIFIARYIKTRDNNPEKAPEYVWGVFSVTAVIYITFGLLLLIFSESFVKLFAPGFNEEILNYAARKLNYLSILPLITGLESLFAALLRAERRFFKFAASQIVFNLFAIPIIYFTAPYFSEASYILAWILGNAAVVITMLLSSKDLIKPTKFILSKEVRITFILASSLFLSSSLGNINKIVDKAFVSMLPSGRIAGMQYATTLLSIVSSVFITGLMMTTHTEMSELISKEKFTQVQNRMKKTLDTIMRMSIPLVVWLTVMSRPLIKFIYEHGEFTGKSTIIVQIALIGYSATIVISPISGLASNYFYIQGKVRIAIYIALLSVGSNILFDWLLIKPFGVGGITAATSLVVFINAMVLSRLVKKEGISYIPWKRILTLLMISFILVFITLLLKILPSPYYYLIIVNAGFAIFLFFSSRDILKVILTKGISALKRSQNRTDK